MANIDLRKGGTAALGEYHSGRQFVLEQELDFTGSAAATAADVIQAINIPAGTHVSGCYLDVTVAEGATQTFDIGTYTSADVAIDADGFFSAADGNVIADNDYNDGAAAYVADNGYYFAAAGYVGVLVNHTADTCVATLRVVCTKVK